MLPIILILIAVGALILGGSLLVSPKVKAFAEAIAKAEGFGANPNNLPTRNHNPGDLEIGDIGYGTDQSKTIFPNDVAGWNALYKQVELIMNEESKAGYSLNDSIQTFAARYTGGDHSNTYAFAIASHLGIDVNSTLGDYFG